MPDLQVQLERTGFYPGQRVAGVVVLRLSRPERLRGIRIRLVGVERARVHYGMQTRWTAASCVDQEVVLVGRERLPDIGAVVVDVWDTVLQRAKHTTLLPGEYFFPFSIPLPSHAPPSYIGKTARVDYQLQLTTDRPMKRSSVQSVPLRVFPPGRNSTGFAVALAVDGKEMGSEDNRSGTSQVQFNVHLDRQEFWSGNFITGGYIVNNPANETLEGLVITLRCREETYAEGGSGREQWDVARQRLGFDDKTASTQRGEIRLQVPENATASISGRTFALSYSLDFRLILPQSSDLMLEAQIGVLPPPVQS